MEDGRPFVRERLCTSVSALFLETEFWSVVTGGTAAMIVSPLPFVRNVGETGRLRGMANTGGAPAGHPCKPWTVMKRFMSTWCYEGFTPVVLVQLRRLRQRWSQCWGVNSPAGSLTREPLFVTFLSRHTIVTFLLAAHHLRCPCRDPLCRVRSRDGKKA